MAVGGICACCAHWLVKGTLIHCPISFTPQAGQGPSRPPTSKPVDCDLGFHPSPLPSLKEDSLASTICRNGPNTILLPLQEALNNYINLPKYGKKIPLQIREAWHVFWLHTGCLARPAVLLGAYCHLECFL